MRHLLYILLLGCAGPLNAGPTLLVGNKGENTVSFVDIQTGKEQGRVPTGNMPHEIAVSPDGKRAAVVAYGSTTVDIFDVATRKLEKRVDLAPNSRPHGIAWLNDGRIVATTEASQSLSIVSAELASVESVSTGQLLSHMVAVNPTGGLAYTGNMGSGTVSVIDLDARKKLADITVGGRPEAVALSTDGRWLWVGDLTAPVVRLVDTQSRTVVAELPTESIAIRLLASPDGKWIVSSNVLAGTISVIDAEQRKVARTIKVSGEQAAGQVTIIFSADGKMLYAAETARNQVAEVDFAQGEVLRRFAVGTNGDGLAIAP